MTALHPIALGIILFSTTALLPGSILPASAQPDALPSAPELPRVPETDKYFIDGQSTLAARKAVKHNKRPAKNVILFIADGMDPTTVTAARIYDGQTRGEEGEENFLSFEKFPHIALAKTYNTNAQTPDSAGTMSAMVTGVKTKIGMISVTDNAEPDDCTSGLAAAAPTLVELAELSGLATGVVSTARLTHATPAATYAHTAARDWERDSNLPADAKEAGCRDIASQLIDFPYGDGLEIAMGGGRTNFLTVEQNDPEYPDKKGGRRDQRDLTAEWRAKSDNHQYVWNKADFDAIDPADSPRILGLFERSHMHYEIDRTDDAAGEPSLADMTAKSIEILSQNKAGYVLVVEAGRVDHAHHGGFARKALHDAQEFSEAVRIAREMTESRDTLIVATADHGHTISFAGYPAKGNDILGLASSAFGGRVNDDGHALASDGKPYTTLTYANGPGSVLFGLDEDGKRKTPTQAETADKAYRQQALIPSGSESHGGQDVTIYADGPHAYLFGGTVEQSYIFHVIDEALSLRARAEK